MKISSRLTVAVHTLLCIHYFGKDYKVTSEFIASSVNVNPVVIRRVLGQMKDSGLVDVARGTGGATIARALKDISLFDLYRAVDCVEDGLFNFHQNPNPACPVGRNIHGVLDPRLETAQSAMEKSLKAVKLSELTADLARR